MSSIHEIAEVFWPVEEEGQWLVAIGVRLGFNNHAGFQFYTGPFASAFAAATWARQYAGQAWGVVQLVRPEDVVGAQMPAPSRPEDPQGEFDFHHEDYDPEPPTMSKKPETKTFEITLARKNETAAETMTARGHFLTVNNRGDILVCHEASFSNLRATLVVRAGAWLTARELTDASPPEEVVG